MRLDREKADVRARAYAIRPYHGLKRPMFGRGRFANRPYHGLILHGFPFPRRHSTTKKMDRKIFLRVNASTNATFGHIHPITTSDIPFESPTVVRTLRLVLRIMCGPCLYLGDQNDEDRT